MKSLRKLFAVVVVAQLAACTPTWNSEPGNPSACPHDSVPSGACTAAGTLCSYVSNQGNVQSPPLYTTCVCSGETWNCSVSYGSSNVNRDASTDR